DQAQRVAERYAALFGPRNFFLEMQCHYEEGDRRLNAGLSALAHRLGLGLVATGNSHYLAPADAPLHDVLSCIRHRVPLERAGHLLRPNDEYCFRRPDDMAALFAEWPQALRATLEIAERCQAQLPPGPQALPAVRTPGGQAAAAFLQQHCAEKLRGLRLPAGQ